MIHRSAILAIGLIAAMAYVVLLGGTAIGEVVAELRVVNALVSATIIVAAGATLSSGLDRVDGFALAAWGLFALAGLASEFPRQSFDAVLAGFTYVAALVLARRAMARVRARRWLIRGLIELSILFTLLFTARWVVPVLDWWQATSWLVVPPLNFEHGSFPWGHRHDVALMIVLLYPAWWTGNPGVARRVAAIAFGVLGALIVLVDGSRALWLAMLVATAVMVLPRIIRGLRAGLSRDRAAMGLVALSIVVGLALVSGVAAAVIQRATNAATLGYRTELWSAIVDAWSSRPLAGFGPGSFPWVLQTTDYFDTNSLAPRHPDSAVIQMLAEGGILGIVALALLVGGVGIAVMRSRPRAARWALLTFAIAALNANPTDFAFLIVVAIGWTAYALPHRAARDRMGRAAVPYAVGAALAVALVGVAYVPTLGAGRAYDQGRSSIDSGLADATSQFDEARERDQGLALYPRQLGTSLLLQGDIAEAVGQLETAARLNPWDDLAWRTLAVAYTAAGDERAAETAIARAVEIQRSDPTNLLLAGLIGPDEARAEIAVEVVQAWPWIVYAPGWESWLPSGTETEDVVVVALDHWLAGEPMPEVEQGQGLWLAALAGDDDAVAEAIERSGDPPTAAALVAALRCEPVEPILDAMGPEAASNHLYLWLRARASVMNGQDPTEFLRLAQLMGRGPPGPEAIDSMLNALDENGQYSTDRWGYRRRPIAWPDVARALPSPGAGYANWYHAGC